MLSRGVPEVLQANAAAPGSLAYRMRGEGASALVVFNTSDRTTLLDNLETGLPAGTVLRGAFAIDARPENLVVGEDPVLDAKRFRRTESGVCLITRDMIDRLG